MSRGFLTSQVPIFCESVERDHRWRASFGDVTLTDG